MIQNKILFNLYKKILRIRLIETEISKRYSELKMRCPTHLSIGQESVPVSICENLSKSDTVVSAHRCHAHYLSKGGNLKKMLSEIYGKKTGCANGRGGSMHLIDYSVNFNAAVPIVGSTLPIGVGIGWANKIKKKKDIVVIFFGDGATEEGVFLESIDFAALHNLKILFICENNQYSVYTNINKRQSRSRSIVKIANSVGVKSTYLKNHNALNVYLSAKKIIHNIKKNSKPHLIEINTFRYLEHCGPNNDDYLNYRKKNEISKWLKKDQIIFLEKILLKKKLLNDLKKKKIIEDINKEIIGAFNFAEQSKFPKQKDLMNYIYA